jgi:phosphatidylglycerol lysyltransferase
MGGDPVRAPQGASALLEDFVRAMNPLPVCAYQVTGEMLKAFRRVGFDDLQIGKEAVFDLTRLSLDGDETEMIRTKVNNARRSGVRLIEHHPCAPGARTLNSELQWINIKWLCRRGKREKGFSSAGSTSNGAPRNAISSPAPVAG